LLTVTNRREICCWGWLFDRWESATYCPLVVGGGEISFGRLAVNALRDLSEGQAGLAEVVDGNVDRLGAFWFPTGLFSDLLEVDVPGQCIEDSRLAVEQAASQNGGRELVRENRLQQSKFDGVADVGGVLHDFSRRVEGESVLQPRVGEVLIAGVSAERSALFFFLVHRLGDLGFPTRGTKIPLGGNLGGVAAAAKGHETSLVGTYGYRTAIL